MNYTEPYVPTPEDVIPKMLTLASVMPEEMVFDLGSGDGRILITAAKDFHARAVGVEARMRLVRECRSFKNVSLKKADVLAMFLSSYALNLMAPKFLKELRAGARIVNFDYPISGWTHAREIKVVPAGRRKAHSIYLYLM